MKKYFENRPYPPENKPPFPPQPPFKPHNHRANFAPPLLQYHIPQSFKFWVNKALPFLYDDSLSLYEQVNKIAQYINNLIEDEKMSVMNIEQLANAYKALEMFVNDYFAFYQSKGLIVYDIAVTNENYKEILPDCDTAQMNTLYRLSFVENSTQNIPANLPETALPWTGNEGVLINVSNFILKYVGGVWQQPKNTEEFPAVESTDLKGNFQWLITSNGMWCREHNGDTWNEWIDIFGNFWSSKIEEIQSMVDASLDDIWEALRAEIERATNRENTIENNLNSEITRSVAKDSELENTINDEADTRQQTDDNLQSQITNEVRRAQTTESELSTAISTENSRAVTRENELATAITNETSRAQSAENALSGRIATWETNLANEILNRTTADETLDDKIDGETSRAEAAEQTLDDKIDGETSRAEAAEQTLDDKIDLEITNRQTDTQNIRDNYIPNIGNNLPEIGLALARMQFTLCSIFNGNEQGLITLNPNGLRLQGTTVDIFTPNGSVNTTAQNGNINLRTTTGIQNTGNIIFTTGSSGETPLTNGNFEVTAVGGHINLTTSHGTYGNMTETIAGNKSVTVAKGLSIVNTSQPDSNLHVDTMSIASHSLTINNYGTAANSSFALTGFATALIQPNILSVIPNQFSILSNSYSNTVRNSADNTKTTNFNIVTDTNGNTNIIFRVADTNAKMYYLTNNTDAISAGREIAVKDDLSTISGFIPNNGNTTTTSLSIVRSGLIELKLDSANYLNITTNNSIATLRGGRTLYLWGDSKTIVLNSSGIALNSNNSKLYYLNSANNTQTAGREIVVKDDIANFITNSTLNGYIPNEGNNASVDLNIIRNNITLASGNGSVVISNTGATTPTNYIKLVYNSNDNEIHLVSTETIKSKSPDLLMEHDRIRIKNGGSINGNGNFYVQWSEQGTTGIFNSTIYFNGTNGYLTLNNAGVLLNSTHGFNLITNNHAIDYNVRFSSIQIENISTFLDTLDGSPIAVCNFTNANYETNSPIVKPSTNNTVIYGNGKTLSASGSFSANYLFSTVVNSNSVLTIDNLHIDLSNISNGYCFNNSCNLKLTNSTLNGNLTSGNWTKNLEIDGSIIEGDINLQTNVDEMIVIKNTVITGTINITGTVTNRIILSNVQYGNITGSANVIRMINCTQI